MARTESRLDWRGMDVVGQDGERIGKLDELYLDRETSEPEWALVKTGLFGGRATFVPLHDARADGDVVRIPFDKATLKDAPRVDPDAELDQAQEAELYAFYRMEYGGPARGGRGPTGTEVRGATALDPSAPTTDMAMTRSEEELVVGREEREIGRVRLRRFIVTETESATIPVRREEVRLEREPITGVERDQALGGADLSEEEHEVVLHAEEPVAEKRVVPKERVRLEKDVVVEDRTVVEDLRRERIEVDADRSGEPWTPPR